MDETTTFVAESLEALVRALRAGAKRVIACEVTAEMVEGDDGVYVTHTPTGVRTWAIREESA